MVWLWLNDGVGLSWWWSNDGPSVWVRETQTRKMIYLKMKIIFRNYRSFFGQTENIFGLIIISIASNTKKYKKYFLMKFGKKLPVSGLINKFRVCYSCQLEKSKQLPYFRFSNNFYISFRTYSLQRLNLSGPLHEWMYVLYYFCWWF